MKKFILSTLLMISFAAASAQILPDRHSFAVKAGVTVSNVSNINNISFSGSEYDLSSLGANTTAKLGYTVGALVLYKSDSFWGGTFETLYSQQGYNFTLDKLDTELSLNLSYINVPMIFNAYLFRGFSLNAGFQLALLVNAKAKYEIYGVSDSVSGSASDMGLNSWDISIPIGCSYNFENGIILDARYNYGVSNIISDYDQNCRNNVFAFTIGYKF